jgi:phage regulator Rha-like protein
MNLINSEVKTMSSREIADMTNKQHSKVMRTIDDLIDKGVAKMAILSPYVNKQNGQSYNEYLLNKRDSLVLVARLSPEFTALVVDRWQELESQQLPQIPQTYATALLEAGRLAQIVDDQSEQLAIAAPKVEVYEMLADRKGDVSTTVIAKQLGMTAIKLNRLLRDNGIKWEKADLPKAGYSDWFNVISDVRNGHEFTQCLVTPLGQIEITKMVGELK